jgi:chromosome segregation ATPase
VPTIEKLDELLEKSKSTLGVLERDAQYFSDLFRAKADAIREARAERQKIDDQVLDLHQQVAWETNRIAEMDKLLATKERIILRNITARKVIDDSLQELRAKRSSLKAKADRTYREVHEMRDVIARKEAEVASAKDMLQHHVRRVEELTGQQQYLRKVYTRQTGRPEHRLLEGFVLTIAPEEKDQ